MRKIEKPDERFEHATACRGLVEGRGALQTGALYEINLHLILSDRRTAGKARTRAAPLICVKG
ncbi:hypothetical protein [Methylocystis sp. SC2]|uniref:hypothetical protein n=1 Tax=Methylocystis sp. (strain SC2) TaxID=187303 RepID=UPI00027AF215|nr:hypothetical protein [Methylocystis sp. SC2]CCJ08340.1 Hypothetical protein BN69_2889 [Methylocystis sp. SC2]